MEQLMWDIAADPKSWAAPTYISDLQRYGIKCAEDFKTKDFYQLTIIGDRLHGARKARFMEYARLLDDACQLVNTQNVVSSESVDTQGVTSP